MSERDLYYVQPDGTWKKNGDGRSRGLKRSELPKGAKISARLFTREDVKSRVKWRDNGNGMMIALVKEVRHPTWIERLELWKRDANETPIKMHSGYALDGSYIGNVKDARYLADRGITPQRRSSDLTVATIGLSAKDGLWYGWSHRAISGFNTRAEAEDFAEEVASRRETMKQIRQLLQTKEVANDLDVHKKNLERAFPTIRAIITHIKANQAISESVTFSALKIDMMSTDLEVHVFSEVLLKDKEFVVDLFSPSMAKPITTLMARLTRDVGGTDYDVRSLFVKPAGSTKLRVGVSFFYAP